MGGFGLNGCYFKTLVARRRDAHGLVASGADFATGISLPVDSHVSPDGFFTTWREARVQLTGSICCDRRYHGAYCFDHQSANGAIVARKANVNITATATDNVVVTRVDFLLDGALQCSDAVAPYSCTWRVPGAMNKTYQLQARAFAAAGNVGTASIQVTAR